GGFVLLILRRGIPHQDQQRAEGPGQVARRLPRLMKRHPALRAYFFANALWETTLSALKAFIILYLTLGLSYSLSTASLIVGAVSLVILVGAAGSGKLGDRYGRIRIVTIALLAYGSGYLVPIFTTSRPVIAAAIPFIALGGGTVMTMAYALLMPLMPEDEHGALTGFYSVSRGVGIVLGPVLAGALIWTTRLDLFKATQGFQAMWIVCAAATFASLFFLRRMAKASEDRHQLEAGHDGRG
ncbi:MAG TPA: MFS transporter, partial [Solirubrobacteraceae bacterium]|nr:MFS transporter [Solirubrobacteraceae bacterium]